MPLVRKDLPMQHDDLIVSTAAVPTAVPAAVPTAPLPPTAPPQPECDGEIYAGYRVHPAASLLPLMEGEQFDSLLDSVAATGVSEPVELSGGLLIDGRNRAHAVEVLRARGADVDLPTVDWTPSDEETVEERIYLKNVVRRHLTDDQRAILATTFLPEIRASRAARQQASRFRSVDAGDTPDADAHTSAQPAEGEPRGQRSSQERFETSTVGRIATLANISRTKARQAVDLSDDVAAGLVPQDELAAVSRGEIPLRKAGRRGTKATADRRDTPLIRPPACSVFDDGDAPAEDRRVSRENALLDWQGIKDRYAITEHRQYRQLIAEIVGDEQREFDR